VFASFFLTMILASAYTDDQPDAVTLIGRLGADSFDDRVAAYKALEGLGGEALPALRAAADTSDARVRARVRALIASIGRQVETDRFARSTMIRLDFPNRPLGEVVDALNDRHDLGLSLRLGPEPRRGMMIIDPGQPKRLKQLRNREITLEAAQPLPFWEAIDRLCKVGALRYDLSPRMGFGPSRVFLVLMADRTGRGPVSDSGPFRVQIAGVRSVFERDFTLDPDPARRGAKPTGVGELTVPLAVLPEPGLMLHQDGAVIVTEATDDRGRSLAASAPAELGPGQANRSYQVMNGLASIQVNAVLVAPDPPGTVIRRLRGKVPVIAAARGAVPIVIPLKGAGILGKPFPTRDMTLVVDEVSLAPGAPASVQVTIRPNGDRVLEHLQLHDAAGRRIDYGLGTQMRGGDGKGSYDRYRLIVSPVLEDGPAEGPRTSKTPIPSELRYYGFVQAVTEVPFDFRDIPMP
jgi:hypothetical protein